MNHFQPARRSASRLAAQALLLSSLVCIAAPATAQGKVDPALLGNWVATGASNRGEKVFVARDHILLRGERLPLRFLSATALSIGEPSEAERVTYQITGDDLRIVDSTETTTWRRVGKRAAPVQGKGTGNPLDPQGVNPLDVAAADPFARKFTGDGMELNLEGTAAQGYRGTLTFKGKAYPAKAQAEGSRLRGSFRPGDQDFPFEAVLDGDRLKLKSGSTEYLLTAKKNRNPLDPAPGPKQNQLRPGWTALVDHPSGIACTMPGGWSVLNSTAQGCVINPGFRKGETLGVTLSLHCLPVGKEAQGVAPEAILASELAATRKAMLDNGGLRTADPVRGVEKLTIAGQPAAFVRMAAQTKAGQRGTVWLALRVSGDKCLVCNSVYLGDAEAKYQPKVQAVFGSLVPAAEARFPNGDEEIEDPKKTGGNLGQPGNRKDDGQVKILQKKTFHDPVFGGIASHTMYLPEEWSGDAKVVWTMAESNYVHFVGGFTGPGDKSICFSPNLHFANSNFDQTLHSLRMNIQADNSGNSFLSWAPQERGEIAVRCIIPRLRAGASDIRLKDVRTFPKAETGLRQMYAPVLRNLSQGHTMAFHVERALVTYKQDGRDWEEVVQYVTAINRVRFRSQYVNANTDITEVTSVRSFRAPAGKLEQAFQELREIADTLTPTPRWSLSLAKFNAELSKAKHEGRMAALRASGKRAKSIADTYSEISDIQMEGWRKRQASQDAIQKATVNSIREVHDYTSRDGSQIGVNHSYDRVFQDALGNLIMTNDPSYNPAADSRLSNRDWQALQRIQHLGR